MATWESFTTEVRTWLADADAQKFSEDELYGYCRRAVIDLSLRLPKIVTDAVALTDGEGTMPADWLGTSAVLVKVNDTFLKPAKSLPIPSGTWMLIGDTLAVNTAATSATVTYEARYECPEAYDADEDLGVPDVDLECLFWYASALGIAREAIEDASLSRWSTKSGDRDDSPLLPEHRWRLLRYMDCVNVRRTNRAGLATRGLYG